MLRLSPYLNFDGNCQEAMEYYQTVFGGELEIHPFSEYPDMPGAKGMGDKVMHAMLTADGVVFMASDIVPGANVVFGDSFQMSLSGDDKAKLTDYFSQLSEGGKVNLPLEKQVWGDTFGMLDDRYKVKWMVNITEPKSEAASV